MKTASAARYSEEHRLRPRESRAGHGVVVACGDWSHRYVRILIPLICTSSLRGRVQALHVLRAAPRFSDLQRLCGNDRTPPPHTSNSVKSMHPIHPYCIPALLPPSIPSTDLSGVASLSSNTSPVPL
ncbi:hypothetical protein C8Q80DRAFT_607408 [Daedaleopsis nitida]|nr:hypothetical protein C8Q80DRAFT_607408 [Daedaleopsis nitida]